MTIFTRLKYKDVYLTFWQILFKSHSAFKLSDKLTDIRNKSLLVFLREVFNKYKLYKKKHWLYKNWLHDFFIGTRIL